MYNDINIKKGEIMGQSFSIMESIGFNDPMSAYIFTNMQSNIDALNTNDNNKENNDEKDFSFLC